MLPPTLVQRSGLVCASDVVSGVMRRDEHRAPLSSQPDFSSVKPEIQEYIEHRGHIMLFGSKCRPECMHIEMCLYQTILQTALWSSLQLYKHNYSMHFHHNTLQYSFIHHFLTIHGSGLKRTQKKAMGFRFTKH